MCEFDIWFRNDPERFDVVIDSGNTIRGKKGDDSKTSKISVDAIGESRSFNLVPNKCAVFFFKDKKQICWDLQAAHLGRFPKSVLGGAPGASRSCTTTSMLTLETAITKVR